MEMAIKPPSDIVFDVARAADPARYQTAAAKLSAGARPVDPSGFDEAMQTASADRLISGGFDIYSARNTIRNSAQASSSDASKLAGQQFEAFVLQTFIESMMPKDAENTFGKGSAGAIWKSMMAEQIAGQVAKSGGIGIADHVLNGRRSDPSRA
jgi:hypothetical protein